MKIGVIHATNSAARPLREVFAQLAPEAVVDDHINEDMLKEVEANSGVTPKALRMFAKEVFAAADAGADGIIIACSVFCGYLEEVRPFLDIPVIAVDGPALQIAADRGGKIGILATTAASAPACREKLEQYARKKHLDLTYEEGVVTEALTALKAGDGKRHDELLAAEAQRLKDAGCRTLFLSQVTMARAKQAMPEHLRKITLTTPEEGVREILRLVRNEKTKNGDASYA